jgi:hypothetical protein
MTLKDLEAKIEGIFQRENRLEESEDSDAAAKTNQVLLDKYY